MVLRFKGMYFSGDTHWNRSFAMLTALPSSPALLNRVLPVLYFDRNLLIPDILNSIKLIFISNGCQGIRICTLFSEKKK